MAVVQLSISGPNFGKHYKGLSTDTKPTTDLGDLSTFWETDTGIRYIWDGAAWQLDTSMGGSIGGYGQTDEELYKTDLYGGTDGDVADSQVYGADIDLEMHNGAVITILFDGSGATNDLTVSVFQRQDDGWLGTEKAISAVNMGSDGSADVFTLEIKGRGHFRLGFLSTGGTDTFDIDAEMRRYS